MAVEFTMSTATWPSPTWPIMAPSASPGFAPEKSSTTAHSTAAKPTARTGASSDERSRSFIGPSPSPPRGTGTLRKLGSFVTSSDQYARLVDRRGAGHRAAEVLRRDRGGVGVRDEAPAQHDLDRVGQADQLVEVGGHEQHREAVVAGGADVVPDGGLRADVDTA